MGGSRIELLVGLIFIFFEESKTTNFREINYTKNNIFIKTINMLDK